MASPAARDPGMNGSSLEYSPHGNALVPERAVEMGRCLGAVNFAGMIQRPVHLTVGSSTRCTVQARFMRRFALFRRRTNSFSSSRIADMQPVLWRSVVMQCGRKNVKNRVRDRSYVLSSPEGTEGFLWTVCVGSWFISESSN